MDNTLNNRKQWSVFKKMAPFSLILRGAASNNRALILSKVGAGWINLFFFSYKKLHTCQKAKKKR